MYPSADQMLVPALQSALTTAPAARVLTDLPPDAEAVISASAPGGIVQVTRFGGGEAFHGMDEPFVDVDCWALTHAAADALATRVLTWCRSSASGTRQTVPTGTGTLIFRRVMTGACRRPSGNPDLFRTGLALVFRIHSA